MGTPYDNYGLTGNNWDAFMNDYYYQMMAKYQNPSFKSTQASQTYSANALESIQDSALTNNAASYLTQPAQESSGGMNFTTSALATAIIGTGAYLLLKKNPNAMSKVKSFLHIGSNNSTGSIKTTLKNLTATKGPDGKIKFLIPGETTTVSGNAISEFVSKHGIQDAINSIKQAFNPEKSKINSFVFNSGSAEYTVKAENGTISGVKDKLGNDILKRMQDAESGHADALRLEGFNNILKELAKTKDVDKSVLNGVTNIKYTNTYGDDILNLTLKKYGETPQLKEFTTLQRFDFNDSKMQALKLSQKEKVFADSKFFKDGKLIDGIKVSKFSDKIGGGNIGNFEGEQLISITKPDGTVLTVDSAGHADIVNKYQNNIDKLVKKVMVKRDYIPTGATLVTA